SCATTKSESAYQRGASTDHTRTPGTCTVAVPASMGTQWFDLGIIPLRYVGGRASRRVRSSSVTSAAATSPTTWDRPFAAATTDVRAGDALTAKAPTRPD